MKIAKFVAILALLAAGVVTVYAAVNPTIEGGQTYTFVMPDGANSTLTFTPSTKVRVTFSSGEACYAAISKHFNGDRIFGAACDAVQIFWLQDSAGVELSMSLGSTGYDALAGFTSL